MPVTNNRGKTNNTQGSIHFVKGSIVYSNIRNEDQEGWLLVKLGTGFTNIHENIKLLTLGEKDGVAYYEVKSDRSDLIGKIIGLSKGNAIICTHKKGPTQESAILKIKYDGKPIKSYSRFKGGDLLQQFATLTINGVGIKVTLNSAWPPKYPYTTIPVGTHKIMAPDYSHKVEGNTTPYREAFEVGVIRHNDIWFPIELQGTTGNSSRYVHLGNVSHGCVTVYDVEKWNIVYNYLITHRTPGTDGKYIGKIIVEK